MDHSTHSFDRLSTGWHPCTHITWRGKPLHRHLTQNCCIGCWPFSVLIPGYATSRRWRGWLATLTISWRHRNRRDVTLRGFFSAYTYFFIHTDNYTELVNTVFVPLISNDTNTAACDRLKSIYDAYWKQHWISRSHIGRSQYPRRSSNFFISITCE